MQTQCEFSNIKLSNIPLGNVRRQFDVMHEHINSKIFENSISSWGEDSPIETPYITWYYWPEMLFTHLIQMAVTGVESYISGAVYFELGKRGKLKENIEHVRNPFSIKGPGGTAAKTYKLLPSLIDGQIDLEKNDQKLWGQVKLFYKEIRNPIFHGEQLDNANIDWLRAIYDLIHKIFVWIDGWFNFDELFNFSAGST